ncbi:hypothetical protein TPCU411_p240 (plasmid) [Cutibacterium acnes]|nr:hypothetical protein TPCU411_p240 [Cutibacterium acnes]
MGAGGLTARQKQLVTTIVTVVQRDKLPTQAAVIAIMTAKQESDLGADPTSAKANGDGDAGPFQQRILPGWYGTLDQVNNDAYATEAFLKGHTITYAGPGSAGGPGFHIPGLVDIADWQKMPLTQAAQAVQGSALPDAYAKWETMAKQIVGSTTTGHLSNNCATGAANETGVSKNLAEAVAWAKSIADNNSYAYVWGGNGKADGGYDCSGLTSALYRRIGISLPRTAAEQQHVGTAVARDQLKVGDLILWGNPAHHVAVYIGGGQMVSADNPTAASTWKRSTATRRATEGSSHDLAPKCRRGRHPHPSRAGRPHRDSPPLSPRADRTCRAAHHHNNSHPTAPKPDPHTAPHTDAAPIDATPATARVALLNGPPSRHSSPAEPRYHVGGARFHPRLVDPRSRRPQSRPRPDRRTDPHGLPDGRETQPDSCHHRGRNSHPHRGERRRAPGRRAPSRPHHAASDPGT